MLLARSPSNTRPTRIGHQRADQPTSGPARRACRLLPALTALCLYPGFVQAQIVNPTLVDIELYESDPIASVELTLSTGCVELINVGLDWSSSVNLSGPPPTPVPRWLRVSPKRGGREHGDAHITLSVDAGKLEPGAYEAVVTVYITTDCDGNPLEPAIEETVKVTLQVLPVVHGLEPTVLTFSLLPDDPPASAVFLYQTGCAVPGRTWSAEVDPENDWLTLSLTGGTSGTFGAGMGDIPITVFADPAGLDPGAHAGTITFSSTDCNGEGEDNPLPATVEVTIEIIADLDGDGVEDADDNCPLDANPTQEDTDQDGVGNACDNCPDVPNPDQSDIDGDFRGDVCDNCPDVDNTHQADSDEDGVGDDCDICPGGDDTLDTDGDGVPDFCDACPADNPDDTDNDGVCDSNDICSGGDDTLDTDGDGVPDFCDACPLDNPDDTDGDGVCDSNDVCPGADDALDMDGDGVPDFCDACPLDNPDDTDGDGVCNSDDACPGADDALDFDGDGVSDGCDNCPLTENAAQDDDDLDGVGDECDVCPGVDDTLDTDGDGVPNCNDACPGEDDIRG